MSAFVDQNRERFGVEPTCRELEGSASAYWARRRRPPSPRAVRDEHLLGEIRRVHGEAFGVYGQFKVWQELNREGIPVARCTVECLMREHGIEGLRKGKTCRTTIPGPAPAPAPDLVRRDFSAVRPDELWLADFTYLRTREGWTYLAVVVDVYTRRIVGWQLAGHMRQSLVSDALQMALAARQEHEDGLVAHSGSGAQYTSYEHTERLVRAGIAPSRGRTGNGARQRHGGERALYDQDGTDQAPGLEDALRSRACPRRHHRLVQRASAAPRLQQAHAPRSARRVQSGGCPDNRGIHVIEPTWNPGRFSGGVILNMGSSKGIAGYPFYADYNASKAGVIGLTRSMALELTPTIRVNAICPGFILTPMQEAELNRPGFSGGCVT